MDIKVLDKSGVLVLSKGQFPAVDPETGFRYDSGTIYKANLEDRAFLAGQVKAGAFTRVDEDGAPLTPEGKKIPEQGSAEAIAEAEAAAAEAKRLQDEADAAAAEKKRLDDEAAKAKAQQGKK